MRIDQLLRTLTAQAWAIEPRTLTIGAQILQRKLLGEAFLGHALHAELDIPMPTDYPLTVHATDAGMAAAGSVEALNGRGNDKREIRVARIPINGMIEPRAGSLGTSPRQLEADFNRAIVSRSVDAVVMDVGSPGGIVDGVPEFSERVFEARAVKPVLGFTDDKAASAAYWIMAACQEIWMLPSATGAGSLGVFMMHMDKSQMLENEGIRLEVISAGKYKLEGVPWAPLSDEAREFLEADVNKIYAWFTKEVARFRGDTPANVRNGYGEGRVLNGQAAVKAGLVDKLGRFEDVVQRAATLANKSTGRRTTATERVRQGAA